MLGKHHGASESYSQEGRDDNRILAISAKDRNMETAFTNADVSVLSNTHLYDTTK